MFGHTDENSIFLWSCCLKSFTVSLCATHMQTYTQTHTVAPLQIVLSHCPTRWQTCQFPTKTKYHTSERKKNAASGFHKYIMRQWQRVYSWLRSCCYGTGAFERGGGGLEVEKGGWPSGPYEDWNLAAILRESVSLWRPVIWGPKSHHCCSWHLGLSRWAEAGCMLGSPAHSRTAHIGGQGST